MDYAKESLRLHSEWRGKLEVTPRAQVDSKEALSLAYTPGVAQPCLEIQKDISKSYELTRRWNTVAVVTDGSAVLGLGDIGPEAGMPVMEGKCVLFKAFGGVDAIPLCVRSHDVDEIVNTVALLAGSFGGVNLEDIAAPRCFEIERKLKERCDIPIFHDDQHGTAVITLAGLTNALKVVGKRLEDVRIVINGAGAAAVSITKLLLSAGAGDVTLCDRKGAIYAGRSDGMNWIKEEMAQVTNPEKRTGSLADVLAGADVFIGVSAPGAVTKYINKISGPLLDRIDIQVELPPVKIEDIKNSQPSESSAEIKKRVDAARKMQKERFKGTNVTWNAGMTPQMIKECEIEKGALDFLQNMFVKMSLSMRAYDKIIKVSRTIADLALSKEIKKEHIAEAVFFRSLDKKYWNR